MSGAYSELFSAWGHQFLSLFQAQFFFGRVNFEQLKYGTKNGSREVRGHATPTKIWKLTYAYCNGYFSAFKQFLKKVYHIFGP